MSLSVQRLCETFRERSYWTSSIIRSGYITRLGILEETITDINLLEIGTRHPDYVLTKKFNRKQEGSESGADWLWCIGAPGSWLPLLVQAKIVNPDTLTCHHLNYKQGEQRKLLQKFARLNNLYPLYCIYSHVAEDVYPYAKSIPSLATLEHVEWSCSWVVPKYVRKLSQENRKKQSDLLQYGIPWTYPFYYATQQEQSPLAEALANAFLQVRVEFGDERPIEGSRIQWENPDPTILITEQIPKIVIRLLNSRPRATDLPIAGVSILSTVPMRSIQSEYKTLASPKNNLWREFDFQEQERQLAERLQKNSSEGNIRSEIE